MKLRYVFGPIPSRRLGVSLGIDLTPGKQCTLNCLYCECGSTDDLTLERREYVPTREVLEELRAVLREGPELDSITFSGSGEPTLHSGIGDVIAMLKEEFPRYRVTVLTNSTLLGDADVRAALLRADLVVPSLDAVSEEVFRKINRPRRGISSAELIEGLHRFSHEYCGELWLEVFIIPGINDGDEEVALFRDTIARLRCTRVQLNSLDRPGAVEWIQAMPRENLEAIAHRLGPAVEVIGKAVLRHRCVAYSEDVEQRILNVLRVRPCTIDDLAEGLQLHALDVGKYLDVLLAEGKIRSRLENRGRFYLL
ncbi:MAG TPA: radical SAM protein [Bacteroidota bacterium]|nr:radical SAM protein [Bacteroidota bacterium]